MRNKMPVTKKIGKRIFTLKEIAQRDFGTTPKKFMGDSASKFSLVNIQEDLLDESATQTLKKDQTFTGITGASSQGVGDQEKSQPLVSKTNLTVPIEILTRLITKEIDKTAKHLDLEVEELQAWLDLQVMVPKQTLLTLLRLARANNLDPLKEEVALALYDDCHWQAYITVEGYSKMLNCHPAFDGISFTQSPEKINDIPAWMECTIYRKDRSQPIVVREYFEEVKGEQVIWQKMPRRMLRHRAMQQCARLAIG
jgi:hypothetical protein